MTYLKIQLLQNSPKINIYLIKDKMVIASETAYNCEQIVDALDRIFFSSKIDKYSVQKFKFDLENGTSEITANILKALTKTVNFLLSFKKY